MSALLIRKFIVGFLLFASLDVSAECDFVHGDFQSELLNPAELFKLEIEIPKSAKYAKNFLKIVNSPSQNIPPSLRKKFKALVRAHYKFGSCEFQAKVWQNGDWRDHIGFVNGKPIRSLNVKLEDGNVANAVKFKLLIPETRNGLNEVFGSILFRELGFISPETFMVETSINDVSHFMLFQEDARKELLERNGRREGPLLEGDESIIWSDRAYENVGSISLARVINDGWMFRGVSSQILGLKALSQAQMGFLARGEITNEGWKTRSIPPLTVNGDRNSDEYAFYFTSLVLNGTHGLAYHNRRWYYNAFENQLEPIYYDGDLNVTSPMLPSNIRSKSFYIGYTWPFHGALSSSEFIGRLREEFLLRVGKQKAQVARSFFEDGVESVINNSKLLQRAIKEETIFDDVPLITPITHSEYDQLASSLGVAQKSFVLSDFDSLVLESRKDSLTINPKELRELVAENQFDGSRAVLLGTSEKILTTGVSSSITVTTEEEIDFAFTNGVTLDVNGLARTINITQSSPLDWILISRSNLSNWTVNFNGAAIRESELKEGAQRFNEYGLTGCLNFYDVRLDNVSISSSHGGCEDSVNLVSSTGSIAALYVEDAFADAVDIDFSEIAIDSIKIDRAGNDCFDVSGGKYVARTMVVSDCGDKGLSVGELSDFSIEKLQVRDSLLGVSSKDLSSVKVGSAFVERTEVCVEALQKKQEFGGAYISIATLRCDGRVHSDQQSRVALGDRR